MKEDNALISKDKASLRLIIGSKLKEFFQSHNIDKMTQKFSDDLRTISILNNKTKQFLQQSTTLIDISQHHCRKCQLRMLEELNQNRSKTPTKAFPIIKPVHSHHNHSLIHDRSMTPELNIIGSHIEVVLPNKTLKAKGCTSGISPSKKEKPKSLFTPSRSKSPSDLTSMKNRKNITKSPTAKSPMASKGTKGNLNKAKLTSSQTDRNVTPSKHIRGITSLSPVKSKEMNNNNNNKKHNRINTSVSGDKNKSKEKEKTVKKTPLNVNVKPNEKDKDNKPSLSPNVKKNIKTPLVGKNKGKEQGKASEANTNSSMNNDEDVQHSINEINKTVKGLKESLHIMDDSDNEIVSKAAIRSKQIKKSNKEEDKEKEEDDNDESICLEKQMLKREKEKRIMEKLRNEKNKQANIREPSPDFNTKNKAFAVCSNDLQIAGNTTIDLSMKKKDLYKSVNYEITPNQKDELIGYGTSNIKVSSNMNIKKDKAEEYSSKDKGKDQGNANSISSKGMTISEEGSSCICANDKKKSYTLSEKEKEQVNIKDKDKDIDINNDLQNESQMMKDKREKIREKVMEKRKEKEKSKEKILKEKNVITPSSNNSTLTTTFNNQSNSHMKQKETKDKAKSHYQQSTNTNTITNTNTNTNTNTYSQVSNQYLMRSISSNNKLLKLLVVTLNSGYIDISKKISIITSSPQLLPAFQLRHLLVEKIAILMKQCSKVKAFLSKYDQQVFTKPFSLTKISSSSISLITKEDELALCKRPQPKEILHIFTALYVILNESHYEVPTKDLVINMVQVLLKKYQVDSIKSLLLNIIPKKVTITEKQMDLLMEIKEASPIILVSSEISKISKAASYICFALQEIYDYIFVQYSDGTTLYQVKKAAREEKELEDRIASLQSYL